MTVRIGTLVEGSGVTGVVVPCAWPEADRALASILVLDGLQQDAVRAYAGLTLPCAELERWNVIQPQEGLGRVVILADLEGATGVPNEADAVTPAEETAGVPTPAYAAACSALTLDVLHAVAGARAAGAREIVVADAHWHDTNLRDLDFDVPVVRGSQAALGAMQGADLAMLIGWHAKAGTPAACLPHTYTDRIATLSIDGVEVGEIGMLERLIASCGVPVVLVAGDAAAAEEFRWGGDACASATWRRTVVTKSVDANGVARHRNQSQVRAEIFCGAYEQTRAYATDRAAARQLAAVRFRPGDFAIQLRPGFEVDPDHEVSVDGEGRYLIQRGSIRLNYLTFQRFVDRLPAVGSHTA